jgi:hypothetical protein
MEFTRNSRNRQSNCWPVQLLFKVNSNTSIEPDCLSKLLVGKAKVHFPLAVEAEANVRI